MRIVVTGAVGRIAPAVCRHLENAGHQVTPSDVREPRQPQPGFVVADLLEPGEARRLLEGAEVLVHLGNHSSDEPGHHPPRLTPQQVYHDNVTMNLLTFDAAMDAGVRQIIFASSVQAIAGGPAGDQPPVPYLPADGQYPANPKWYYGLSKVAGEQTLRMLCREEPGLSALAFRFPYMPPDVEKLHAYRQRYRERREHRRGEAAGQAVSDERAARRQWHRGKHIYELFTYLLADDAAALVGAAVDKQPPGCHVLFPAADETYSGESPADLIERHFQGVPLRKPVEQFTGLVDNSPITELLGWRPTPPAQTPKPADAQRSGASAG